jgi:hypothetical protein
MARTLDVYLFNDLAGHLMQDDGGQMVFGYAGSWLGKPGATLLSHSSRRGYRHSLGLVHGHRGTSRVGIHRPRVPRRATCSTGKPVT